MYVVMPLVGIMCLDSGAKDGFVSMVADLKYQRILLKMSGEALGPQGGFGIDAETVRSIAREVQRVHRLGVQVAVVIGGGNMWRGADAAATGIDRATADYVGMLATD